jgi:DNA-directed RNA polymerase subunit beta
MANRINFGQLQEIISPPNLIENQINSFMEFLQLDKNSNQRKLIGLERVFKELFPIESYDSRCSLEYVSIGNNSLNTRSRPINLR